jgi:hypothetical protein
MPGRPQSLSLQGGERNSYVTTHHYMYQGQQGERAALEEGLLRRLRTHNFDIGQRQNRTEYVTSHALHYPPKEISHETSKANEQQKDKMRGHSHKFDEGQAANPRSLYSEHYIGKQG